MPHLSNTKCKPNFAPIDPEVHACVKYGNNGEGSDVQNRMSCVTMFSVSVQLSVLWQPERGLEFTVECLLDGNVLGLSTVVSPESRQLTNTSIWHVVARQGVTPCIRVA